MVHRKKSPPPKDLALERMHYLFKLAEEKKHTSPELAERYIDIAERIAKRLDISLPKEIKRFYCKRCGRPYGDKTRVRVKKGLCLVTCGNCGDLRRLPYRN